MTARAENPASCRVDGQLSEVKNGPLRWMSMLGSMGGKAMIDAFVEYDNDDDGSVSFDWEHVE